jgi:hypothetical protein
MKKTGKGEKYCFFRLEPSKKKIEKEIRNDIKSMILL